MWIIPALSSANKAMSQKFGHPLSFPMKASIQINIKKLLIHSDKFAHKKPYSNEFDSTVDKE